MVSRYGFHGSHCNRSGAREGKRTVAFGVLRLVGAFPFPESTSPSSLGLAISWSQHSVKEKAATSRRAPKFRFPSLSDARSPLGRFGAVCVPRTSSLRLPCALSLRPGYGWRHYLSPSIESQPTTFLLHPPLSILSASVSCHPPPGGIVPPG